MRVLLVGEKTACSILAPMVEAGPGRQVVGQAHTGPQGLALALALSPDLIILDEAPPGIDGLALLERLRQQGCLAAVILCSPSEAPEQLRRAMRLGAADHLPKPLREGELAEALARLEARPPAAPAGLRKAPDAPLLARAAGEDSQNLLITQALDYVRQNYRRPIALEDVAEPLNITPEYLSTLFHREVGVNFSAFVRLLRISHAKRLLRGTRLKVYEIAALVGYTDEKYFSRVFREEAGVSPQKFRQLR